VSFRTTHKPIEAQSEILEMADQAFGDPGMQHGFLSAFLAVVLSISSAHAGDSCAAPTLLQTAIAVSGDTLSSTPTPNIQAAFCNGDPNSRDDWYTYTAGMTTTHTFSLCDGAVGFDSVLQLWSACPDGTLTPIVCNDNANCYTSASLSYPMTAGQTVLVRVSGATANDAGPYTLSTMIPCWQSITNHITIGLGSTTGVVPSCIAMSAPFSCQTVFHAVWYKFVAINPGVYQFDTCGPGTLNTVMTMYGRFGPPELGCNDDTPCSISPNASSLTRSMLPGDEAWIGIGGRFGATGSFTLNITDVTVPPANDDCANPTIVGVGSTTGDMTAATLDASSPCGDGLRDVWFEFTAPNTAIYQIDTCDPTGFDSILSIRPGCAATEYACNDDSPCPANGARSVLTRAFAAGETVKIRVAAKSNPSAAFVLNITDVTPPPPPPANDACSDASVLIDGPNQPFDSTSATGSGLALSNCGPPIVTNDIFYTYTASCTGSATLSTCGSSYDTVLAVFDQCNGVQLACNDNDPICTGGGSTLTFSTLMGSTYIVVIAGSFRSDEGPGFISVSCAPCLQDFNQDGFVDFFDYDAFVDCYVYGICPTGMTADFNNDGFVDFFDYDDFVAAFEAGC
jgi:hypothetical protein